ncbi:MULTISPECIES: saccharopine dehydrogenase NADP-binding domain-containing protein [unclassified Microbulbifer]|uniref:saccharopine dehydrogenase family protein n=1 Tax=unclassified Microbulbifer TaxID=2619833 RepID=UPI0027E43E26|nr:MULTISPECIES: saccharopine dehydrogenase NADP-binding domain-containing protein [unclassified Microbulbifer]
MIQRVLIIGGYGNFGRFIAKRLARNADVQLIIAGRNREKAHALAGQLDAINTPEATQIDITSGLADSLEQIAPDIVIHTSGPYQLQDYKVAKACIDHGCHYIDLADGRNFVNGIAELDRAAKERKLLICSGASSVPALSSAIIDQYIDEFGTLERIEYAIATAQLTNRGLATTLSVLSYAGKPFKTLIEGRMRDVYGWLGLRFRKFHGLGSRPLGNCDIPDLDLFPKRYPSLKTIRFRAGLELKLLHLILAAMSWLVSLRLFPSLSRMAPQLLKISRLFDIFGDDGSGFYMELTGRTAEGKTRRILFEIVARHGDGLYIPCIPAILMTQKLIRGETTDTGAHPCIGFIDLDEYLAGLSDLNIQWQTSRHNL